MSIVIAAASNGQCRLFLISNFEEPEKRPLQKANDKLRVFEISLVAPVILVNGTVRRLPRRLRKTLEQMLREQDDGKLIREQLAVSNRAIALQPKYKALVSEGCWIASILADGSSAGVNYGQVSGIPAEIMNGFNWGEYLRKNLVALPGKKISLVQSAASGMRAAKPSSVQVGEPKTFDFSTPDSNARISFDRGPEFARVMIKGLTGKVVIRKNQWTEAVLNTITFEVDPTKKGVKRRPLAFSWPRIANVPIINGATPRDWNYSFDVRVNGNQFQLVIQQMSMAFRSANYGSPLTLLGPNEELVMAAPTDGLILTASSDLPVVHAQIKARFLLRSFVEAEEEVIGA